MKSECYFENKPWDLVCDQISSTEGFNNIIAISVHVICSKKKLEEKYNEYKDKTEVLLSKPLSTDIIKNELCISVISKYKNAIVRIFIDTSENEQWYDNFEIVTHNSLYVWKPTSRPQMHFEDAAFSNSSFIQKFSNELGGCN